MVTGTQSIADTNAPATAGLVLIVDDSRDIRSAYAEYLKLSGFRVLVAADGLEGLAAAHAEWPDVIVMDLAMPRMDGWDAIRRLKENPRMAHIPIVALSAYAFDESYGTREVGADVCLTKPCLPSQVARVVRTLLAREQVQTMSWE